MDRIRYVQSLMQERGGLTEEDAMRLLYPKAASAQYDFERPQWMVDEIQQMSTRRSDGR